MSYLAAAILGMVEGLTEFLPISSTAHLILTSKLLGLGQTVFQTSFEIIIQLGAILAVMAVYWRSFLDWSLLKHLVVAFIPTGVIGFLLAGFAKSLFSSYWVIISTLGSGGIVILLVERYQTGKGSIESPGGCSYRQAALVGLCQALAIIPGVSRAAATILGGRSVGFTRVAIVEFSFLLAVPTMLVATGYEFVSNYREIAAAGHFGPLILGFSISFLVALTAIRYFLAYIRRHSFAIFGWYRIIVALFIVLIML